MPCRPSRLSRVRRASCCTGREAWAGGSVKGTQVLNHQFGEALEDRGAELGVETGAVGGESQTSASVDPRRRCTGWRPTGRSMLMADSGFPGCCGPAIAGQFCSAVRAGRGRRDGSLFLGAPAATRLASDTRAGRPVLVGVLLVGDPAAVEAEGDAGGQVDAGDRLGRRSPGRRG